MKRLLAFLLLAAPLFAQGATHSVTLTWTDTSNPVGSTTYNPYRATGLCSGTPVFAKLATGITAMTYLDSTVTPGPYCYEVTATVAGVESSPSNTVNPTVPSFPPAGLTATVAELLTPTPIAQWLTGGMIVQRDVTIQ